MLKIVVVDDEIDALEVLEWKLKRYISNIEITLCSSPREALKIVEELKPDLIFLDIQMPEMDGFTFLDRLKYRGFQLIFTTAFNEFAIKAIKVNAMDYLLKPIDKLELIEAVEKARIAVDKNNISNSIQRLLDSVEIQASKVNISADGKIYLLEPDEVVMLQSDKSYTTIFLECEKKILVSKTLKEVEKKFTSESFYRVHNSYLINLNHVKEYFKKMGGELVLTNGLKASVSRNKKSELLEKLQLNK
jgi:two-component system LytT family response regulator